MISAEDRIRLTPRSKIVDGKLFLNYTANFLWIGRCRGELAQSLRLRGAALKAFSEIGLSSAVRAVLAKALDPRADGFRRELDPNASQSTDITLLTTAVYTLQSTLQKRDEVLAAQISEAVVVALKDRDDRILQQLGRQCEQLSLKVVFAMQKSLTTLVPGLSASLSRTVCFNLSQKFKDLQTDFRAAVSSPTGAFVDALRKAVKLPAMKRTTNAEKFPDEQRATPDEERFVESLSTLLTEELERVAAQNSLFRTGRLPALSYGAWKRCRSLIGSRCLSLRKLTGDASKPLLWSNVAGGGRFNGGGQHYVYLKDSKSNVGGNAKDYLRRVLKQKLKKSRGSPTVEEHLRQLIASTPPETWPLSSSDVDVFEHDAAEEKLGAEMEG